MLGLKLNHASKRVIKPQQNKAQYNDVWISCDIPHSTCRLQLDLIALNALKPGQNGRHFPYDIFKCIFLNENVNISINISVKFAPVGSANYIPALVQIMAWRRPRDKSLSVNQWWLVYWRIYASRGLNEFTAYKSTAALWWRAFQWGSNDDVNIPVNFFSCKNTA